MPRAAVPLPSRRGPSLTGVVSEPTEPEVTDAPAVATLRTVKVAVPGSAFGPTEVVARPGREETALAEVQADALVMVSGMNAFAAVCRPVRVALRAWRTVAMFWLSLLPFSRGLPEVRSTAIS